MDIKNIPRVPLGMLPTPLERVPRLSKALGIPNLYFKRDDLTGIGYGGNKIRKLEYLLADAVSQGANTIITTGGVQSNFTRETTACAVKLGLKTVLVLIGEEPAEYRGNLLIEKLMGADIYFVTADNLDEGVKIAQDTMESLKKTREKKGDTCYILPVGGSTSLGCIGFANAFLEFNTQAKALGVSADYIILATGSGGTQAGLIVGKTLAESSTEIVGIRVGKMFEPFEKMVADKAAKTAQLVDITMPYTEKDVTAYTDFIGEGYDIPTTEANEAIQLVARTEAVLLDPVYTGKAMAGLIGLVDRHKISRNDTIIFWHTGGDPALFVGEELLGSQFIEDIKK
jgi:D-cysteine desulfhydrase family pyridoxal phosphate-dependent enzyme